MEKYSRGRRGAPAKGIGRETGARVQIPPSPLTNLKKFVKKLLTWQITRDNISLLRQTKQPRTLKTKQ